MRKGHPTQSEEETARRTRVSVPEWKRMERKAEDAEKRKRWRLKDHPHESDGGSKVTLRK